MPLQISLNSFLHVPEKTKQTFPNCINVLLTAPLETIVERNIVIKAAFSSYLLPLLPRASNIRDSTKSVVYIKGFLPKIYFMMVKVVVSSFFRMTINLLEEVL